MRRRKQTKLDSCICQPLRHLQMCMLSSLAKVDPLFARREMLTIHNLPHKQNKEIGQVFNMHMRPDSLPVANYFRRLALQGIGDNGRKLHRPFVERAGTEPEYGRRHNNVRGDVERFTSLHYGEVGRALVVDLFGLAGLFIAVDVFVIGESARFDEVCRMWPVAEVRCP